MDYPVDHIVTQKISKLFNISKKYRHENQNYINIQCAFFNSDTSFFCLFISQPAIMIIILCADSELNTVFKYSL